MYLCTCYFQRAICIILLAGKLWRQPNTLCSIVRISTFHTWAAPRRGPIRLRFIKDQCLAEYVYLCKFPQCNLALFLASVCRSPVPSAGSSEAGRSPPRPGHGEGPGPSRPSIGQESLDCITSTSPIAGPARPQHLENTA